MTLTSKLFGYKKSEVDRYIDRIGGVYQTNIENQINEINLIRKEEDQLRREVDEMSAKRDTMKSYEVLKLSLNSLGSVYSYLEDYEQDDSNSISSREHLIKEKHKEIISKIENEIREIKESTRKELDQINKIIKPTNLSLITTKDSSATNPIFELNSFWGTIENRGLNQVSATQEEQQQEQQEQQEQEEQREEQKAQQKHVSDSHGLKAQIDIARYKFILGKIAGEDLFNAAGGVIINKHDEITPEVVEVAQKENKLSELIINMLVQGMDE